MLFSSQPLFFASLCIVLCLMLTLQIVPAANAILILVFSLSLVSYQHYLLKDKKIFFYLIWCFAIVTGILIGIYRPIGFTYPVIFSAPQLYDTGLPFTLSINTAKCVAGYAIVYLLLTSNTNSAFITGKINQYLTATFLALLVLCTAYFVLHLEFHIKTFNYIALFALTNLLSTCVAEEAFMRLLLQEQLHKFLAGKIKSRFWIEAIPLFVTALIFALTHFSQNQNLFIVYALAGFTYGLVYSLTRNFLASISTHFLVNMIHFSLLTYPIR
jgi:uncharacterized protein